MPRPTAADLGGYRAGDVPVPSELAGLAALLEKHGFMAADEEAAELLAAAAGDGDRLEAVVERRLTGEPLAWITGTASFCGLQLVVAPGVYVPRYQSEQLARRALERLPPRGTAIDLCTGSGAVAKVMMVGRPQARVMACDLDERAVACAAANGVETFRGDLFSPFVAVFEGCLDVLVSVAPYVPTGELGLLQRDTFTFESPLSYDGGPDGAAVVRRVMTHGRRFLRAGGTLLLELGGEQADLLGPELTALGYCGVTVLRDEDGDVRGIEATLQA